MAKNYKNIKRFWSDYLTYDAQKALHYKCIETKKILEKFAKKMNNKFFVYHNEDTKEVIFYDICTIPDDNVQVVCHEYKDKLKSSVVETCVISVLDFKIRYKLTEAIYDKKCENVILPAAYSKDFDITEIENIKIFKTYREAREYYYTVCECNEIDKAIDKIESKYDKKRRAV